MVEQSGGQTLPAELDRTSKDRRKKVVEMDGFGYSIQDIHVITFEVKIEMKAKQKVVQLKWLGYSCYHFRNENWNESRFGLTGLTVEVDMSYVIICLPGSIRLTKVRKY